MLADAIRQAPPKREPPPVITAGGTPPVLRGWERRVLRHARAFRSAAQKADRTDIMRQMSGLLQAVLAEEGSHDTDDVVRN